MDRHLLLGVALTAMLSACQEYDVQNRHEGDPADAEPDIAVTPVDIAFPAIASTDREVRVITLTNEGDAPLTVDGLALRGDASFTLLTPLEGGTLLDQGETVEVQVAFTPQGLADLGELDVLSDDPDEPVVTVALSGQGLVPALSVRPEHHTFPGMCEDALVVDLVSVGAEPLTITGIDFSGDPDLTLVDDNTWPLTLAPDERASVTVALLPVGSSTAASQLVVHSDDPRGTVVADQTVLPAGSRNTETFLIEADPPVDILFAIDRSGSMTEEARKLANAFDDFIADIAAVTTSWQIGVVTRDGGCFNNGIIDANTPYYEDVFKDAVTGIFAGDLTEALLAMVYNALKQTAVGGCNDGFVRPDSLLHIVVISDEPEQSGTPWQDWVAAYQAPMSDPDLVVISAVVDEHDNCGTLGTGYIEAAQATGGLILDVCNSNWGAYAAKLGGLSAQVGNTFLLAGSPEPGSIEVAVDGVVYSNGWHYDPGRNAIIVDVPLPEGSSLSVTYDNAAC